ncbi:MotA/TolQ/ExbB proton channel family protein [Ferrimonas aestuarii]|nr:MotA/TolQ/ExbB proton channel family protein [Ferrimonas aestuarii]
MSSNYRFCLIAAVFTVVATASHGQTGSAPKQPEEPSLEAQVNAKALNMRASNQQWQQRLTQEQQQTQATTASLKTDLASKQAKLKQLQNTLAQLQQQKQQLKQKKQQAEADLELVQSSYQQALSGLGQRWQHSTTAQLMPQRQPWLTQQLAAPHFPAINELSTLIDYAMADIRASAAIETQDATVINRNGQSANATLTLLGTAMIMATQGSDIGLVDNENRFIAIDGDAAAINHQWLGGGDTLMMDISQGALLPFLAEPQGLLHTIKQGGELLWPLLAVAAAGMLTLMWCAARLFYWRPIGDKEEQHEPQVLTENHDRRTPAKWVLAQGACHQELQGMDYALKQGMLHQVGRFERGLGLIGLLAALAPMLGLLGTVSGMIETFQSLTQFGNSEPKLLSSGISKALITTEVGLVVAIPLLLLLHPLKRRAQRLTLDMERHCAWLLAQRAKGLAEPEARAAAAEGPRR